LRFWDPYHSFDERAAPFSRRDNLFTSIHPPTIF
jgi:hypothetical protein